MSRASHIQSPGLLDTNFATESIVLVGWVLDKPLDADKLRESWEALLTAWPILGARLRRDTKTKQWSYDFLEQGSVEGAFASLHIDGDVEDHYTFSSPSPVITLSPKSSPLHLFMPEGPRSMTDIINKDRPVAHLHITTFRNASMIGIAIPHLVCDAGGFSAVVHGLERIIKTVTLPEPQIDRDPFATFKDNATPPPAPRNWRITQGLQSVALIARFLWIQFFGEAMENRDFFIPNEDVSRIKDQAMNEIRQEFGDNKDLWVSSSDAILAFCLKCAHPPGTTSTAPVNVFYTANARKAFGLPINFLHNSVIFFATDAIAENEFAKTSLGALALRIRKTLQSETTKPAMENWIRWRLHNEGKIQVCFDPVWGKWHIATNWREMKFMEVDWSGALPASEKDKTVKCRYQWMDGLGPVLRDWLGLIADDPRGGLWVAGTFSRATWENRNGFGQFIRT